MARTKKVQSDSSENQITMNQDAYDKLVEELNNRVNVLRAEIAEEISIARDLGDLSENHGYTVAIEKKDMNENRISELEDLLQNVKIVTKNTLDDIVGIGEKVEIENQDTKQRRVVMLVGSEESQSADPLNGIISTTSPIGSAIFNAKIGSSVTVHTGSKDVVYKIIRFLK